MALKAIRAGVRNEAGITAAKEELGIRFGDRFQTGEAIRAQHAHTTTYIPAQLPDAVVFAESAEDVREIVQIAARHKVPLIPFGTGSSLEGHINAPNGGISVDLARMNKVLEVNAEDLDCRVEPGITREELNTYLRDTGLFFPIDPGANASIGGMASTRASGTNAVRYGTMKDNVLALTVVTADGREIRTAHRARKSSAGYDLTRLFVGAEGTLGIITGAVLKLYPQPKASVTALAAMESPAAALRLLSIMQDHCGASLTGFELMSAYCLRLVAKHFPALPQPLSGEHAQYALLELSSSESEQHAAALLERALGAALDEGVAQDAVVASSAAQSRGLWDLREHIPLAQAADGKNIKHDISLPVSSIADFIGGTEPQLQAAFPGCQLVCFGHLGDGNLHFNVAPPAGVANEDFLHSQEAVNRVVHDAVAAFGGSISAEHGIGALKRDELARYKSPVELNLMRAIKAALDPLGLMNPGKIL